MNFTNWMLSVQLQISFTEQLWTPIRSRHGYSSFIRNEKVRKNWQRRWVKGKLGAKSDKPISWYFWKMFFFWIFTYSFLNQGSVRDKLSPVNITLDYWLASSNPTFDQITGEVSRLASVINKVRPSFLSKQLGIRKNCGRDNICKPDLELSAQL